MRQMTLIVFALLLAGCATGGLTEKEWQTDYEKWVQYFEEQQGRCVEGIRDSGPQGAFNTKFPDPCQRTAIIGKIVLDMRERHQAEATSGGLLGALLRNTDGSSGGVAPNMGGSNGPSGGLGFGGLPGTNSPAFLGPYEPNAYGPGINSDATGRPFMWKPDFGGPALGPINPNSLGPGIGTDATGRPVRPACPLGAGPC